MSYTDHTPYTGTDAVVIMAKCPVCGHEHIAKKYCMEITRFDKGKPVFCRCDGTKKDGE